MTSTPNEHRAPVWTTGLGALFGLMGLGVSAGLASDPTILFPTATAEDPMLGSWVVRNATTAAVLLVVTATRRPDLLAVGFLARALTEAGDALLAVTQGNAAGLPVPLVMLALDVAAIAVLVRTARARTA